MSELQKPLENTDVHLVSVSVDPEHDTPAVLRDYAEKLHAQPQRWDFLTGSSPAIYDLSRNGFKLAIADGSGEMGTPVHSTRLVLVDRQGEIRGYYDAPGSGCGNEITRGHESSSARTAETLIGGARFWKSGARTFIANKAKIFTVFCFRKSIDDCGQVRLIDKTHP